RTSAAARRSVSSDSTAPSPSPPLRLSPPVPRPPRTRPGSPPGPTAPRRRTLKGQLSAKVSYQNPFFGVDPDRPTVIRPPLRRCKAQRGAIPLVGSAPATARAGLSPLTTDATR